MEHRFPGGGNHREHRDRWHHKLDAEVDVPWQSADHQSVERELFAKQCQHDGKQLELQRDHSAGRKVQRGGLYRKLQRNEYTACELLSEWSHLPLVADLAMVRADIAHPEAAFLIPADPYLNIIILRLGVDHGFRNYDLRVGRW